MSEIGPTVGACTALAHPTVGTTQLAPGSCGCVTNRRRKQSEMKQMHEAKKHAGGRKPAGTVVTRPDGRLQGIITQHGRRKAPAAIPQGHVRSDGSGQDSGQDRTGSEARNDSGHWRTYLKPILGSDSPKTWQREQFRKIAASLDSKVQANEISWKTARNIDRKSVV